MEIVDIFTRARKMRLTAQFGIKLFTDVPHIVATIPRLKVVRTLVNVCMMLIASIMTFNVRIRECIEIRMTAPRIITVHLMRTRDVSSLGSTRVMVIRFMMFVVAVVSRLRRLDASICRWSFSKYVQLNLGD